MLAPQQPSSMRWPRLLVTCLSVFVGPCQVYGLVINTAIITAAVFFHDNVLLVENYLYSEFFSKWIQFAPECVVLAIKHLAHSFSCASSYQYHLHLRDIPCFSFNCFLGIVFFLLYGLVVTLLHTVSPSAGEKAHQIYWSIFLANRNNDSCPCSFPNWI